MRDNPWLADHVFSKDEVRVFNLFARTLARLGVIDFMFMEIEQQEYGDAFDGSNYYLETWVGVIVAVGDEYEEYEVINDVT